MLSTILQQGLGDHASLGILVLFSFAIVACYTVFSLHIARFVSLSAYTQSEHLATLFLIHYIALSHHYSIPCWLTLGSRRRGREAFLVGSTLHTFCLVQLVWSD